MFVRRITIIIELVLCMSNNLCCNINDTHAVILARGGSRGIKNKNLMQFNGRSLLGGTIETIKKTGLFPNIWVSTDSDLIESEALKYNALVYRRLPMFARDHSSSLEAIKEFLNKHRFVQRLALFQCTSVFLKEKYISDAFRKFEFHPCVFAATKSHKLRWKMLATNSVVPLNFNPTQRPRRQDWEGEFEETGMFYFTNKELLMKNCFQNTRCGIVEIDALDSIEIDKLDDLKIAQCILDISLQSLY